MFKEIEENSLRIKGKHSININYTTSLLIVFIGRVHTHWQLYCYTRPVADNTLSHSFCGVGIQEQINGWTWLRVSRFHGPLAGGAAVAEVGWGRGTCPHNVSLTYGGSWCCLLAQGLSFSPCEPLWGSFHEGRCVCTMFLFLSVLSHGCGLRMVTDLVWYWCTTVNAFMFNREECGLYASASSTPAISCHSWLLLFFSFFTSVLPILQSCSKSEKWCNAAPNIELGI